MNAEPIIPACYTEQIATPGTIQPWGALLIASLDGAIICHASDNLEDHFGLSAADAIGLPLEQLIGSALTTLFLAVTADDDFGEATLPPRRAGLPRLVLDAHRHDGRLYVECEPAVDARPARPDAVTRSLRSVVRRLRAATSKAQLFKIACHDLRQITGFDRAMAYRFDIDHHGEVVAESHADGIESLLGLHYPAEDIPPPAWAVFARLPIRVIADTHAAPVTLLAANPDEPQPDLSLCALRSPSACHMEYLRNMGSGATATIALTVNGTLWGLLACHHRTPAHLTSRLRGRCALIGQVTSLMIGTLFEARMRAAAAATRSRLLDMSTRLLAQHEDPASLADVLAADQANLLALCEADGAVIRLGGRTRSCGAAPDGAAAEALLDTLMRVLPTRPDARPREPGELGTVFDCDSLARLDDPALPRGAGQPVGALLLPLPQTEGGAVLWLRNERLKSIEWGGNPAASLSFDPARQRFVPRGSFDVWCEVVRGRSLPWRDGDFKAAVGLGRKIDKALASYADSMRLAREAAERATRAKSEFLATMSHEIRSPLSGLLGVLELLRATRLDAEQGRMAGMIYNSASMLLAVLNDVLDFSKIEAGALSIETEPVQLRALVRDLLQPYGVAAAKKGIAASYAIDSSLPDRIATDPLRLRQILGNLLSNAVKFTAAGQIRVMADAVCGEGAPMIRFQVEDTGIGMTGEVMGRLFSPFMQADGSTTRKFGGTGLGLCISRQLAGLLGGTLTVSSEPGRGSTFCLTIPFVACPVETADAGAGDVQAPLASAAGHRILVVDDDATIRWLSQKQLETLGFAADVADEGETALRRLAEARYDLLLTDCHMPHMDGVSLTRAIRASEDPALRTVPIVGLTADVTDLQRTLCLEAGMDDLAIKPLTVDRLSALLRQHLKLTPEAGAAPEAASAGRAALRQVPFDDQIFLSIFPPGAPEGEAWLTDFLVTARADADRLRNLAEADAAAEARLRAVAERAHRLAGAAFSAGAVRLGAASRALEQQAANAGGDLAAGVAAVVAELAAAEAAIAAFIRQHKAAPAAA